ncbi:hypothetical protein BJV77DRAFT_970657 [Russula vinacea]|nr:hypothetical protein BJV77DRAFT_970657 [Russula vinacea]
MRLFLFFSLFLVPFTTVLAQNNNTNTSAVVTTLISTGVSVGQDHQTTPFTSTLTLTLTSNPPASSGNTTGNSTNSNSTSTNSTSTKPTSTAPLPTAPTNVDGGGGGPGGAPSPGQTGDGGAYGPPDGYVSGVTSLQWNAMVVGIAGVIIGVLLPLL